MGGLRLSFVEYMLQGAVWTVVLTALAFLFGGIAGFGVMLARTSRSRTVRALARGYVEVIQGTPLLVLLFIAYFGLGIFGIEVPALVAAAVSLMINSSAFLGEIWKGCVEAVPRTQREAAECLALTRWQAFMDVILPQAIKIAIPPTVGFMVQLLKNTSLASVVGFVELTRAAQVVNDTIVEPFTIFGIAGLLYFALCYPLTSWSRALERRMNVGRR